MEFAVITKVPERGDRGNLATQFGNLFLDPQATGGSWDDPCQPLGQALGQPMIEMYVQSPVFALGEVLIMGGDGREIVGDGRKPSKWSVDVEYFDTVEEAVRRSHEVCSESVED